MKDKILNNWKAGLTVSLVSIPLSMALAIASGATPTQGIITAVWAGIIAGFLGSSNFNITGPTGALSGILVSYAILNGYQTLPLIAVISGLLILIAFLFHLDKYIIFIPRSVIHGFTLGVAFIIGLGQFDNAFGLLNVPKTENFVSNVWASLQHLPQTQWHIFGLFLLCALFIVFWNKKYHKIPGPVIVAFLAIIIMAIFPNLKESYSILTLGDKYPDIRGAIFENPWVHFHWGLLAQKEVWLLSAATAVVAILETLLSGQIADHMTKTHFNRSKEVFGLAIANIGSGLMGGIPATAALARTALNIKSGADHKISAVINAIFVALICIFFMSFFKLLPMFVIASILVIVALGMVQKKHFIHLIENEKVSFFLSIFVAIVVVVEDPIVGILVGSFIALLIFVNRMSYGQTEVLIWKNGKMTEAVLKNDFLKKEVIDSDIIVYKISGTLTYVNMPAHLEAVEKIKDNKYVVLSLRHAFYADTDGVEHLKDIIEILKQNNETVILSGVNKEIEKLIHKEDFYKRKLVEGKIYKRTSEAIDAILKKG